MTAQAPPAKLSDEYEGRTGAVLARVQALYPKLIDLSLDRLRALLDKLGNPERGLPPVIHVAGTNGKGSTCATLRAIAEAAGWSVHVMTSPHLVDVTERFRIAGKLVSEDALVAALEEIERINAGHPITVFEVLTAAGLLLFARNRLIWSFLKSVWADDWMPPMWWPGLRLASSPPLIWIIRRFWATRWP